MVKLGKIMQIFLHISPKRDNSRSSKNKMKKRVLLGLFSLKRVNSRSSEIYDEILGALGLVLAQARNSCST